MKKSLKLLSVLTALALLFAAFPLGGLVGSAAEVIKSGEIYPDCKWSLDSEGTLVIEGSGAVRSAPVDFSEYDVSAVEIREGISYIDGRVFDSCNNVKSISIAKDLKTIWNWFPCANLEEFIVAPDNPCYSAVDGVLYGSEMAVSESYYMSIEELQEKDFETDSLIQYPGGKLEQEFLIPAFVQHIGEFAFETCRHLKSISVAEENENYFARDGVLFERRAETDYNEETGQWEDAGIRETLIRYPANKSDVEYRIPDNTASVNRRAFLGCKNLKRVSIPAGVETASFESCDSLTEISVDAENETYFSEDGVFFKKEYDEDSYYNDGVKHHGVSLVQFPAGKDSAEYQIPGYVESISWYAFQGCRGLKSVTIPDTLAEIAQFAFQDCVSLESVTVGGGVETIPMNVFRGCENLRTATIRDGVKTIGEGVFFTDANLKEVYIPGSVEKIGQGAFSYCDSLTDVYYAGTKAEWEQINKDWYYNDALSDATIHCSDGSIGSDEPPTTEAPTTEAPTTEAPTTEAPTTEAPTTEAPTTEAPTTEAPTTEAPTTEAPTTEAPTTEAPTTEAPTTEEPYTENPSGDLSSTDEEKAVVNDADNVIAVLPGMTAEELKDVLDGDVKIVGADGSEFGEDDKIGTGARVIVAGGETTTFDISGMDMEELKALLDDWGVTVDLSDMSAEELIEYLGNLGWSFIGTNTEVSAKEYEIVVPGDTDGDGKVGAADARAALRASAKIEPLDGAFDKAADVSGDGKTKASDARTILRVAAKLEKITKEILATV